MLLFNALTHRLEEFVPKNRNDVKIYCCGPTVYNGPHLGHARTYIFLDVLRRILRYHQGYGVRLVVNITDDKIINQEDPQIARKYERAFFKTMDQLNAERPDFTPRVTDFIGLAKQLSKQCMVDEFAYYKPNFDIVFSTEAYLKKFERAFPNTVKRDQAFPEGDSEVRKGKWDPRDFTLFKSEKQWKDTKGKKRKGMPGWHTECASIASYHFGESVDIHVGGIDLEFPHHENEIAICCTHFNKEEWVRFFLHTGHLEIEGKKMSKSLDNSITLDDMLVKGYPALAIRYMFLKHSYDKPMAFKEDEVQGAKKLYGCFMHHMENVKSYLKDLKEKEVEEKEKCLHDKQPELDELNCAKANIDFFLMDNLNVPKALQLLEEYVKRLSTVTMRVMSYEQLQYCYNYVLWMTDKCFGLILSSPNELKKSDFLFPILKKFRSEVREHALMKQDINRDHLLKLCDEVRESMHQKGYTVEDLPINKV